MKIADMKQHAPLRPYGKYCRKERDVYSSSKTLQVSAEGSVCA
jgi:hypothetical protein